MSNFVHKFFSDPIVGLLAVGAIALMFFLGWSEVKERRAQREALRRRAMQGGEGPE
jgi:hypothetical protein